MNDRAGAETLLQAAALPGDRNVPGKMGIFIPLPDRKTGMCSRTLLLRSVLFFILLLIFIPWVSGWTLQNWKVSPAGSDLPPGTPVSAGYSIHFDSWTTGSMFDKDNSLIMNTDLANPQWVVTKVEPMDNQEPVTEQLAARAGSQTKLDGWTLSYSRKQFDIVVQLTGKIPDLNQSGTINIVKLQEMSPGAKAVAGSLIRKEARVLVATPGPTLTPLSVTINMTPAEIIEITPEPAVTRSTGVPAKKVTYSPGPEPVLIAGMLAGFFLSSTCARRRE